MSGNPTRLLPLLLLSAMSVAASDAAEPAAGIREIAEQTLARLRDTPGPGGMPRATLGQAYQVFFIRLDRLAAYERSKPADGLLSGGTRWIYPVNSGKAPGAAEPLADAIVVEGATADDGKLIGVGDASVSAMRAARSTLQKSAPGAAAESLIYVQVPALNRAYVGRREGPALWLREIAASNLPAGAERPATVVFHELSAAAKKVDPDSLN
jgi:hypothetical protein